MQRMEQTFADRYRELDDDALLRIANDRRDLEREAAEALDAELGTRKLTADDAIAVARGDRLYDKQQQTREQAKNFYTSRSRYTSFYGHWNVEEKLGVETYTATKFFVLGAFPLIPLGTYRLIRTSHRRWWEFLLGRYYRVLEKVPLDWSQVCWIWCEASAFVLAAFLVVRILISFHR